MQNDWKLILKVVLGSALLMFAVIWGLTKVGGQTSGLKVDEAVLLSGARWIKENGDPKVTVVKFSDIQCPVCKVAEAETKEINEMQGVRVVVRHYPLPASLHKYALISAKAAEAGRVLGKGWEMMALLFEKQEEWSVSNKPEELFAQYAKSLGLDEKQFTETMNSSEVANFVQTDADVAASLRLTGTPTIFVNGEQVGSPFVVDKVKQLLSNQ